MDKCREEFEKLPEIVEILSSGYYYFIEASNEYYSDVEGVITDRIDLAWSLYQKQQKVIDTKHEAIESLSIAFKKMRDDSKDKQSQIDVLQKKYEDLNARASQIAWDQMTTAKLNYELEVKLKALQKELDEIS